MVRKATQPSELVSSIWTERRDSHIEGMSDLANGSGGMFRYLHMAHDLSLNKYEHKFPLVARAPFSLPVLFFLESFRKHTHTAYTLIACCYF